MINLNPSMHIESAALTATLARVARKGTLAHSKRHDGAVDIPADALDQFRVDTDAALLESHRQDADLGEGAAGLDRSFEHIRSEIFEDQRRPLSSFESFPIDSTIPLGAKSYTSRRSLGQGEATLYAPGSTNYGSAKATLIEETRRIQYVVCGVETNELDLLASDFANLRQYQRDMGLAVRLVREKINKIAWHGINSAGLVGVLNQPSLGRVQLSTAFTLASDPAAMLQALNTIAQIPFTRSGGTFQPNRMRVSPRIWSVISTTRLGTATDTTIAEFFLRTQPGDGIRAIEVAQELADVDGTGVDGIFAYSDEPDSTLHVLPQAPTVLPIWRSSPLDSITVVMAATGGVEMVNVGNNILGMAEVS